MQTVLTSTIVEERGLLPLTFLSVIVIWMSRYYARISDDIIKLQDDGVYQIRRGVITQINWDAIIKVEWDKTKLEIISQGKMIEIGDHISNIDIIINRVKSRVGERLYMGYTMGVETS